MPIRKKESNVPRIIFALFMVFIMVAGIFGFAYSLIIPPTDSIESGGLQFVQTNTGIATSVNGQFFEFTYFP